MNHEMQWAVRAKPAQNLQSRRCYDRQGQGVSVKEGKTAKHLWAKLAATQSYLSQHPGQAVGSEICVTHVCEAFCDLHVKRCS